MSIVSKMLVIFTVVMALGLSTMVAVYATVQPNYRDAFEKALSQAQAANAVALAQTSDRFVTSPQRDADMAFRDSEIRDLTKQLDEQRRLNKLDKDQLQLALTQISGLTEPLNRMESQVASLRTQLTAAQEDARRLNIDNGNLLTQLAESRKISVSNDVEARIAKAQLETSRSQSRSLDEKGRALEQRVSFLETQLELTALAIQSQSGDGGETSPGQLLERGGVTSLLGTTNNFDPKNVLDGFGRPTRGYARYAERVRIRGKVTGRSERDGITYLMINVGEDDRVFINNKLQVFQTNPPRYIGVLTVIRSDFQNAAGRLELARPDIKLDASSELEVTNDLSTLK